MSYELGALRDPLTRAPGVQRKWRRTPRMRRAFRGLTISTAPGFMPRMRRRLAPVTPRMWAALTRCPPTGPTALGDLGISLRPPKWLRKAQPGKILKKYGLPAAAVAAFFVPGVAPVVTKYAFGAAKLALRGGKAVGRGVARRVVGLFRPRAGTPPITEPRAPSAPSTPEQAFFEAASRYGATPPPAPEFAPPSPGQAAPQEQAEFQAAGAAPAAAGGFPLLLVGGLGLLALMATAKRR